MLNNWMTKQAKLTRRLPSDPTSSGNGGRRDLRRRGATTATSHVILEGQRWTRWSFERSIHSFTAL